MTRSILLTPTNVGQLPDPPIGQKRIYVDAASGNLSVMDQDRRIQAAVSGDGMPVLLRRPAEVHAAPPTITYSATAPASGRGVLPWQDNATPAGCYLTYNLSAGILDVALGACGGAYFELTGDAVTLGWRCQTSTAERVMVFVDGFPCMSAWATPSVSTSAGSYYYVSLAFASVATRRVEILVTNVNGLTGLYTSHGATVARGPRRRTVMIVGDSFNAGSAALSSNTQLPSAVMATRYDANVVNASLGGTGYVSAGSFTVFGSTTRVAGVVQVSPDDIVFMGSINDDSHSATVATAATACWAAYKAAAPRARIHVFGPQPTNATATLGANRLANNAAVQAAAVASSDVDFVYDMIGNGTSATAPPTYVTGNSIAAGALVSYIGAIWRHDHTATQAYPGSGAPGTYSYPRWTPLTMDLYGTGQVGSTTGNGSRDTFLHSDGDHPTAVACQALAGRMGYSIERT